MGNDATPTDGMDDVTLGDPRSGPTPERPEALSSQVARASARAKLFGRTESLTLGRYRLLEPLGAGAMGEVFAAEDPERSHSWLRNTRTPSRQPALSPGHSLRPRRYPSLPRISHFISLNRRDETLTVFRWSADGYVSRLRAESGEVVSPEPFETRLLAVATLFGDEPE